MTVLHGFLDGGNQPDSRQHTLATLACISGTPNQWRPFEKDWKKNLIKHKVPYLHTTDVVSGNDPFSLDNGWDDTKKNIFMRACVRIAGKHTARRIRGIDNPGRLGLHPFTITVVLADFVRCRKEKHPGAKNAPEALATQALEGVLRWGHEHMKVQSFHLFFDQNEPYLRHIYDRKHSKRARKDDTRLDDVFLTEADAKKVPALQLADLYAWSVSQQDRPEQFKWQTKLLKLDREDEWLDYNALLKKIRPGIAEKVEGWKLPPKKDTR